MQEQPYTLSCPSKYNSWVSNEFISAKSLFGKCSPVLLLFYCSLITSVSKSLRLLVPFASAKCFRCSHHHFARIMVVLSAITFVYPVRSYYFFIGVLHWNLLRTCPRFVESAKQGSFARTWTSYFGAICGRSIQMCGSIVRRDQRTHRRGQQSSVSRNSYQNKTAVFNSIDFLCNASEKTRLSPRVCPTMKRLLQIWLNGPFGRNKCLKKWNIYIEIIEK